MKNENILLNQIPPVEIRLEVYKSAFEKIETKQTCAQLSHYYLCLMLPCILWDLSHYLHNAPQNITWDDRCTPIMFPELTKWHIQQIDASTNEHEKNVLRLNFLQEFITQLESIK